MTVQRWGWIGGLLVGLMVIAGCGGPATTAAPVIQATATPAPAVDTPAPPAATPTSAPAAATATTEPEPTAAPEATPTEAGARVTLKYVSSLSTVEEVGDIRDLLIETEGILAITGNEIDITFTYDPAILTVDDLRGMMARIGYPVQPPE